MENIRINEDTKKKLDAWITLLDYEPKDYDGAIKWLIWKIQ